MLEGHRIWMTKGKRVDTLSTWEISVHSWEPRKREAELPYNISERISEEDKENGERKRRTNS